MEDLTFYIEQNGRTLVPIRAVAEKLGYTVDWAPETKTASIGGKNRSLTLTINKKEMKKVLLYSGQESDITLDVPPQIINDRTYLPLRAVGEALGCNVSWNEYSRTVTINED